MWILLTACAGSCAACTPAITIFPMCSWTICAKIAGSTDLQAVETFLHWLDRFSEQNGVKFTVTISADEDTATEGMKQYI